MSEHTQPTEAALHPEEIDRFLDTTPRRRWGWWIVAVLASAGLAAVLLARTGGPAGPGFETVEIERRDLVATVSATGNLEPTHKVDVGCEISGTVAEVRVDSNDRVEQGQILAVIDTTKLEQQTDRLRATLLSAQAQLSQATATQAETTADLERFEEVSRLSQGKVPSKIELDAARAAKLRADAAVEVAQAQVEEARASVLVNETDLSKSVIRSPIDGIVLERAVEPGQTLAASFQAPVLFTIGRDLSQMDLTVFVSEADVSKVEPGQSASFTVDAWPGTEFEAVVQKISFGSQTIQNVVSYQAELEVANEALKLRPGMTATATIRVAERRGVLVVSNAALRFQPPGTRENTGGFSFLPRPPEQARSDSPGEPGLYVVREGSLARVPVATGLTDGRSTEVRATELTEGDEVVVEILGSAS